MRCIYGLLIYLFNYSLLFVHGGRERKFWCSRKNPEHGKIEVKYRGRIAKFVCDPGYVLRGDKLATCLKGSWDSFPKCEKVGGCAYLETLENGRVLISKDMSIIKFECDQGYKRSGGNETLACKDFSWERHKPTCEPDILRRCDFDENTICDWRNSSSTGFSWHLHQNKTPSRVINTGPAGDHTPGANGAGHYLYIETSGVLHFGSNNTRRFARLFSPMIFPMEGFETCFVFWYHMYGLTIGTLNIYVNNMLRFTKSGNQGDRWYRGLISNLPTNETFVIEIEGVSGSSYLGDIAIDDIMITNSSECQKPMLIETTCRGRCFENEENATLCRCSPECVEDDSCCTDFMHYCNLKMTTESAEETTEDYRLTSTEYILNTSEEEFTTVGIDFTQFSTSSSESERISFEPNLTTRSESGENSIFTDFSLDFVSTDNVMTQKMNSTTESIKSITSGGSFLNITFTNNSVTLTSKIYQTESETVPTINEPQKHTTTGEYIDTVNITKNHTHLQNSSILTSTTLKYLTTNSFPLSTTEIISTEKIKPTTITKITSTMTKPTKKYSTQQKTILPWSNKKWNSIYSPKGRYTFSAIKQEQSNTTLTYLSLILGVILIFTCLIGVSLYMFRRRKLHVSIQQEEAEVIYLTSDEALDFTVGRR